MAIVAFLSAILAGMGVGSAGFLVVYLTVFSGYPQLSSQLMNLIFFISSASAAIAVNLLKKRLSLKIILLIAVPGVAGAIGGAAFAHSIENGILGKAFGVMLIAFGLIAFFVGQSDEKYQTK